MITALACVFAILLQSNIAAAITVAQPFSQSNVSLLLNQNNATTGLFPRADHEEGFLPVLNPDKVQIYYSADARDGIRVCLPLPYNDDWGFEAFKKIVKQKFEPDIKGILKRELARSPQLNLNLLDVQTHQIDALFERAEGGIDKLGSVAINIDYRKAWPWQLGILTKSRISHALLAYFADRDISYMTERYHPMGIKWNHGHVYTLSAVERLVATPAFRYGYREGEGGDWKWMPREPQQAVSTHDYPTLFPNDFQVWFSTAQAGGIRVVFTYDIARTATAQDGNPSENFRDIFEGVKLTLKDRVAQDTSSRLIYGVSPIAGLYMGEDAFYWTVTMHSSTPLGSQWESIADALVHWLPVDFGLQLSFLKVQTDHVFKTGFIGYGPG